MDAAPKSLLNVVRCNCRDGCDTLRCSCRKVGLGCSTDCGECRDMCANMYENITEDNEYEEETYVVIFALTGTIRWSINVFIAAILKFRELFGLTYVTL